MDRCCSQGFHSAHIIFLERCHSLVRHVGLGSFFQITFWFILHVGAGWHVCYSEHVEVRGQPLSTMWVPGIKFRPSCLVAWGLTHVVISPALAYFFILILWITVTQLGIGRDSQNCLELGLRGWINCIMNIPIAPASNGWTQESQVCPSLLLSQLCYQTEYCWGHILLTGMSLMLKSTPWPYVSH